VSERTASSIERTEFPQPLRILIVATGEFADSREGLDRHIFELTNALRELGFGVEGVVVGSTDLGNGFVRTSPPGAPLLRRLYNTALEGRARSRAADVINGHFGLYTLPVLWGRPGKPLVEHFDGPWHEQAAIESTQPRWLAALRKCVELSVYRRAREVIVPSDGFRRVMIENFGILPSRVHVVRPGVDLERFCPIPQAQARRELELSNEERAVLCVRRLNKRVGLDVLLRAWAAANADHASLYIVGDGPERCRLQDLTAELCIERTVHFVGAVPEANLPIWYAAANVSVVPSIALEGFGLVVLESLASGTPVIASNTVGMAEMLPDLWDHLLVSPGNVPELAEALSAALQTNNHLPTRGECRGFAEGFQWRKTANQVSDIFQRARSRPPDRKYRVVFLDHCAKLSGGELALVRLLSGSKTIDPHVILGEDGPLLQHLRDAGISAEVLLLRGDVANLTRAELQSHPELLRGVAATTDYVARLARRLRRLGPDLVHTNSLKAGIYGSVAARAARIPIVWHLRDRLSEDSYPGLQTVALRRCVRMMADAVICNSTATAELLHRGKAPVWVVPSPVDVRPATRAKNGRLVIGMVGRLAPWKGQHVFLNAIAQLLRNHPTLSARVVGEALFGEHKYSQNLHRQAEELGIADIVEFVGFTHDIAEELAKFTVAVHASIAPEPFGQIVVEAMACGVPIVASNAGGPAETIAHRVDGILVPPGDADALADAVAELITDTRLNARLVQAGMTKAKRYRPEQVAAEVEAVYAAVMARYGSQNG
jgi:glycosyltransferase involved in cell wall biosynthesis